MFREKAKEWGRWGRRWWGRRWGRRWGEGKHTHRINTLITHSSLW